MPHKLCCTSTATNTGRLGNANVPWHATGTVSLMTSEMCSDMPHKLCYTSSATNTGRLGNANVLSDMPHKLVLHFHSVLHFPANTGRLGNANVLSDMPRKLCCTSTVTNTAVLHFPATSTGRLGNANVLSDMPHKLCCTSTATNTGRLGNANVLRYSVLHKHRIHRRVLKQIY
ncbi:hypothetical protein J6590_023593 [Homalodisca vitripennis]|nr:hypothetical protein J6590_023593 [Homalodisca vitripennis]